MDVLIYLHAICLIVFCGWMLWVFVKKEWNENYATKN